ncbi:MAG: peroxide stress protein YaaA [Weeksellaceae bacterium]
MKILLSPAKLMSMESSGKWVKTGKPKFLDQSEILMYKLKTLKTKDLEKLMSISPSLAEINKIRNEVWHTKPKSKESLQAILAFQGEAYRGLSAEQLDENAQEYLNENLFILSGLYGILSPKDRIMPYRLEMGSKFAVENHKNLYEFWKEDLTRFVNSKLKKNEILLNLASDEYAKAIDDKKLKSPKINVKFLDFKNGQLKPIMAYFKNARGAMTKYCAKNNITDLEGIKHFNEGHYAFDEKLSSEKELVFVR